MESQNNIDVLENSSRYTSQLALKHSQSTSSHLFNYLLYPRSTTSSTLTNWSATSGFESIGESIDLSSCSSDIGEFNSGKAAYPDHHRLFAQQHSYDFSTSRQSSLQVQQKQRSQSHESLMDSEVFSNSTNSNESFHSNNLTNYSNNFPSSASSFGFGTSHFQIGQHHHHLQQQQHQLFGINQQQSSVFFPSYSTIHDISTIQNPIYFETSTIQLWQFLLELLEDKRFRHIIRWVSKSSCPQSSSSSSPIVSSSSPSTSGSGRRKHTLSCSSQTVGSDSLEITDNNDNEFIILDPNELAKRWGARRDKMPMCYRKFCRALRYYYNNKKILLKTAGKRNNYRFLINIEPYMQQIHQIQQIQENQFNHFGVDHIIHHLQNQQQELPNQVDMY